MSNGPMIRRDGWGVSHAELKCEPIKVEYDFELRQGRLFMAEDNCCDMTGCIKFFERMDQGVLAIYTFAAGIPDISYLRNAVGWSAKEYRP